MDPDPQEDTQGVRLRTVEQQRAGEDTPLVQDALSQATPLEEGEIDEREDTTVRMTHKLGREDDDTPLPNSKKDQNKLAQPHGYKAEVEQQQRIINIRNTTTDAEKKARIIAALKGPNGMAIVQLTAPLIEAIEQGTDMGISIQAKQAGKEENMFQMDEKNKEGESNCPQARRTRTTGTYLIFARTSNSSRKAIVNGIARGNNSTQPQ